MNTDFHTRLAAIPCLFNNDSILEFSIEPDKRFLHLGKSFIEFYVELPEDFIPDNNFCNKLFDNFNLSINYEDCSYKCSQNDLDLTSQISDLIFRDPAYLRKIRFEGHFDEYSLDSSQLKAENDIVKNRRGELFVKQVEENGKMVDKNFYRYQYLMPINHGLATGNHILPAGVHVRLSFHRAKPAKALVDISDQVISYPEKAIKINNPILNSCWAFSQDLTEKMSQIRANGLKIPFDSACIRHKVLDDGLSEHTVMISHGPLPKYLVFFLMEPIRFTNDLKYSSSKMEMYDLQEFSLILDNQTLENYPLRVRTIGGTTVFTHEFYRRWLQQTGQYQSYEDMITETNFIKDHFMVVETFADSEQKDGILSAKLKFPADLHDKLFLCWMPVTEKVLNFDTNLAVSITSE